MQEDDGAGLQAGSKAWGKWAQGNAWGEEGAVGGTMGSTAEGGDFAEPGLAKAKACKPGLARHSSHATGSTGGIPPTQARQARLSLLTTKLS